MTDYQTINVITLERLNNAEYLSFMHNVLALLPLASEEEEDRPGGLSVLSSLSENGVPALGLSAEFMNEFEQEIEMLADVVDETRIAPETETMNANDKLRSSVTTFVTSNIANACKSPISTEATAGNELACGSENGQNQRAVAGYSKGRKRAVCDRLEFDNLFERVGNGKQCLYGLYATTASDARSFETRKWLGHSRARQYDV